MSSLDKTMDVENEVVIAFYTQPKFLVREVAGKKTLRSSVYRRGEISRGWVVGVALEMVKERPCSSVIGTLIRPTHQLVSHFSTKGIVHNESPRLERHWPRDKGEDSSLTDSLTGIVPNDRAHVE